LNLKFELFWKIIKFPNREGPPASAHLQTALLQTALTPSDSGHHGCHHCRFVAARRFSPPIKAARGRMEKPFSHIASLPPSLVLLLALLTLTLPCCLSSLFASEHHHHPPPSPFELTRRTTVDSSPSRARLQPKSPASDAGSHRSPSHRLLLHKSPSAAVHRLHLTPCLLPQASPWSTVCPRPLLHHR
jgi:hypothetical protein